MKPNYTTPPSANTYHQYSTSTAYDYNVSSYSNRQTYPIEQPTNTLIDQACSLKRGPTAHQKFASLDLGREPNAFLNGTGPKTIEKPRNPLPQNLTVEDIENYVDNGCNVPLEGKKIRFFKARSGDRNSVRYTADTGDLTGRSDHSIMGQGFQHDPNFSTRNMDDMYSTSVRELTKPVYYEPVGNSYSPHPYEEVNKLLRHFIRIKKDNGITPDSKEKILELVRGSQAKSALIPTQKHTIDYTYGYPEEKEFSPIEHNILFDQENKKVEPKEIETYWPNENYEEKRFESVQTQSIVEEASEDTDSDLFDSYYDELGSNHGSDIPNKVYALDTIPQKTLLETINTPTKPVRDPIMGNKYPYGATSDTSNNTIPKRQSQAIAAYNQANQETNNGDKKDKVPQNLPSQRQSVQLQKYEEELERLLGGKSKDGPIKGTPVKESKSEKQENISVLETSGDLSLNESLWESLNNSNYLSQVRRRHKSGLRYTEIWTSWQPNPDRKNSNIPDSGSKPLLKFSKAPLISYCFDKYEK